MRAVTEDLSFKHSDYETRKACLPTGTFSYSILYLLVFIDSDFVLHDVCLQCILSFLGSALQCACLFVIWKSFELLLRDQRPWLLEFIGRSYLRIRELSS